MDESDRGYQFVYCLRCQGHGHFVIPGHGKQFEVFSKIDAFQQLTALTTMHRISLNHNARLTTLVQLSALPISCPPDVEEFIRQFCRNESWVACYSENVDNQPTSVEVDPDELALAVHEYILQSSGRPLQLH